MSDPRQPQGPVIIEIDENAPPPDVGTAPPVDHDHPPQGRAMQGAIAGMGRRGGALARLIWSAAGGFLALALGLAAWDYTLALIARLPVLGWAAAGLLGVLAFGLLAAAVSEIAGYRRLRRLDDLRTAAERALADADLAGARAVSARLGRLYAQRPGPAGEALDAETVIEGAEAQWLIPLDALATAEVESAARQVALVTAMVPLALADVLAALFANLRMIRRIAALYGGRAGTLGSLRLARVVALHLMATGAVAVGDDLIGSVAGGGVVSKLSRRFGEGVVNGALTARVGIAAIEVCRPLPFRLGRRPAVSALLGRALKGAFQRA